MIVPISSLLRDPIAHQSHSRLNRALIRLTLLSFGHRVINLEGSEWISGARDPFVLALNHSQRLEAILLPILFAWHRQGKLIHFLADWNYLMMPGVSLILRRGGVIPVTRKQARPRFLTGLRKFLVREPHGFEQARLFLRDGRSVGVFPEGTTNRHPTRMLVGQRGAARLSLETGAPVIPVGVRFPENSDGRPIAPFARMEVRIGPPMPSPKSPDPTSSSAVRAWHEQVMREISILANKGWSPTHSRRKLC